jgi:hypothetical protein
MRNFSEKNLKRKSKHIFCVQEIFSPENRAVYEIMWENIVELGRPQKVTRHRKHALCIPDT